MTSILGSQTYIVPNFVMPSHNTPFPANAWFNLTVKGFTLKFLCFTECSPPGHGQKGSV
jgi:hypothetical protein